MMKQLGNLGVAHVATVATNYRGGNHLPAHMWLKGILHEEEVFCLPPPPMYLADLIVIIWLSIDVTLAEYLGGARRSALKRLRRWFKKMK